MLFLLILKKTGIINCNKLIAQKSKFSIKIVTEFKMKLTIIKSAKLLLILLTSFLLFLLIATQITTTERIKLITVDVNNFLSDVSNNPVGINMNFLRDSTKITKSLKDMKVSSLRYPMGEIADYYLFDKDNPAVPKISLIDPNVWVSSLTNSEGQWPKDLLTFDDFMSISQSVGSETFIVIGIDAIAYTGTSPHATPEEILEAAVEWVRYANIVKGYGIKYWEIGNENDLHNGGNHHKNWTAEKYANTVVQFSKAMKAVDPSIKIGVNGMSGSEWWDRVMPIVKDDVDFLVTHQYSSMKNYKQWKTNDWNYTSNIGTTKNAINTYNPELRLNVTENSSYKPGLDHHNNIWKTLHNFELLGNTIRFDQVDYYHFWVSRWFGPNPYSSAASAFNSSYQLMPMGFPLKVWGNFLKKKMVSSSKSGTIRSWASYDPDDGSLNLFLLNKDTKTQKVSVTLHNYLGIPKDERWVLEGSTPESKNVNWRKYHITTKVRGLKNREIKTKLNPLSVTVIEFEQ